MGSRFGAHTPCARRAHGPRVRTCLTWSWLHLLKSWSLLKTRGASVNNVDSLGLQPQSPLYNMDVQNYYGPEVQVAGLSLMVPQFVLPGLEAIADALPVVPPYLAALPALMLTPSNAGQIVKDQIYGPNADPKYSNIYSQSGNLPRSPGDVLAPNGQPIGHVEGGATPDIRTVSPGQLDGIINGLKGLGAKQGSKANYPGDWYDLPDGQGGFGVRDSKSAGRTLDVNIPGVPDVTKLHQKP